MSRVLIAALIALAPLASAGADEPDEATKLAVKLTTEGAATFNTKDARAMAASYLEDAQLAIVTKEKDTGTVKSETKSGRAAIEDFYRDLFKDAGTVQSKNVVEYARRLDADILLVAGIFYPDLTSDGLKVPFVQVRQRQGEKWVISSMQIFMVPQN